MLLFEGSEETQCSDTGVVYQVLKRSNNSTLLLARTRVRVLLCQLPLDFILVHQLKLTQHLSCKPGPGKGVRVPCILWRVTCSDWIPRADLLQRLLHGPANAPALVCCHPKKGLAWTFLLPQIIFKLCKQRW